MRVGDICKRSLVICGADTKASALAEIMRDQRATEVLVVETGDARRMPKGIVTFRDMVVRVLARRADPDTTTAANIMSAAVECVQDSVLTYDAVRHMRDTGVSRLVVVDSAGSLVGVLTDHSVIEFLAGELIEVARVSARPPNSQWSAAGRADDVDVPVVVGLG